MVIRRACGHREEHSDLVPEHRAWIEERYGRAALAGWLCQMRAIPCHAFRERRLGLVRFQVGGVEGSVDPRTWTWRHPDPEVLRELVETRHGPHGVHVDVWSAVRNLGGEVIDFAGWAGLYDPDPPGVIH